MLIISILSLAVKGDKGSPIYFQSEKDIRVGGPFEASNSNSRYALTEAISENRSFFLNTVQAKFASPDLVEYKEKFITIFTPGVSFIGVPFYLMGKFIGLPQLLTFLSVSIFALINVFLVSKIASKLGVNPYFSFLSGLIFLFGTNALAYSQSFTQHHISTTLIMTALLIVLSKRSIIKNVFFGLVLGAGILVDIPNIFLMGPIAIYLILKHFLIKENKSFRISLKPEVIAILFGLIPALYLFGWYNFKTTNSYTLIGQNIGRTDYFADEKTKTQNLIRKADAVKDSEKNPSPKKLAPFDTRKMTGGLYILVISNERGIFYYSPVLLFGVLGLYFIYKSKKNNDLLGMITSIIGVNVLLYSMFSDPWGGWSFGPRYLIPAAALLSSVTGVALSKLRGQLLFKILFIGFLSYSIFVNSLGVLTTSSIPPKVEAVNLPSKIPYTYKYNIQLLNQNRSSSLFYNLYLKNFISVKTFLNLFSVSVLSLMVLVCILGLKRKEIK